MKITDLLVTKAYAQVGGGGSSNSFNWDSFNFLRIFNSTDSNAQFNNLFGQIIGIVLTISAIVAFVYLLTAGFQYITSGGDAAKAQTARQSIINALIGILVIMISYAILRYVGTALLKG